MSSRRLASAVVPIALALLSACADDAPGVVDGSVLPPTGMRVRVVRADSPLEVERLAEAATPVTVEVRDVKGRLARGATVKFGGSTGWLVNDSATTAATRLVEPTDLYLVTDSMGRVRVRWFAGPGARQRLLASLPTSDGVLYGDSLVLAARGTVEPLRDTIVAPSSFGVTCVLRDGRVGCLGLGARTRADSLFGLPSAPASPAVLRWLALPGPMVALTSHGDAACARRGDGRIACWQGLGPDGAIPLVEGVPPLVALHGDYGLTADGHVGTIAPFGIGGSLLQPVTWRQVASDSTLVALAMNEGSRTACALARSGTVLCLAPDRELPGMAPRFRALLDSAAGGVVRAVAVRTVVAGLYGATTVHWRDASGAEWDADGPSGGDAQSVGGTRGWRVQPRRAVLGRVPLLDGALPCIPDLDPPCVGAPWRSAALVGRWVPATSCCGGGAQRRCAARDGLVACRLRRQESINVNFRGIDRVDTLQVRAP